MNTYTGALENDSIVYWMTIIPEHEAEYVDGQDTLINYLKESVELLGKDFFIKNYSNHIFIGT
jgi:hypothetical protein